MEIPYSYQLAPLRTKFKTFLREMQEKDCGSHALMAMKK